MSEKGSNPAVVTTAWDRLGAWLELTVGIEIQTLKTALKTLKHLLKKPKTLKPTVALVPLPASWQKTCPLGRVRVYKAPASPAVLAEGAAVAT